MRKTWLPTAWLLVFIALGGCRNVAWPSWSRPGPASAQQKRALRYDPYPENEPGPSMDGVRPREYEKPPPETSRARWQRGHWGE